MTPSDTSSRPTQREALMSSSPSTARRTVLGAAALTLALGAALAPAGADPLDLLPPDDACLADGAGVTGTRGAGEATYQQSAGPTKGKGQGAADKRDGAFAASWSLDGPSCRGASYVLTVRSAAGKPGWSTTSVTGVTPLSPETPVVRTATASSDRGTTTTVTIAGDSLSTGFTVQGTTSRDVGCLYSRITIVGPDGSVLDETPAEYESCPDLPPGQTYW